jgi:hypothetical protein
MLSPNSFFRYKLLDQDEEMRNKEMDLQYLEKQYKQNISFLDSQITEIEKQIAIVKETSEKVISYEGSIKRELQKKYEKMEIFNFYAEDPIITWLKKLVEINKVDLIKLTKLHLNLINKLVDTIAHKDENEDGLDNVKNKLLNLHIEEVESDDCSGSYQPPGR